MIPEGGIAMLVTSIGAIHSVVFGGFSPTLARPDPTDSQAKLITADAGLARGQIVLKRMPPTMPLERAPTIENVIVVERGCVAVPCR